ncbi:hypothetical protein AGMMS50267_14840 [Spirochaetia bacterium]|nr:hypothetical protein AGMMS50267_14840 [Spirochaetia bacterium]
MYDMSNKKYHAKTNITLLLLYQVAMFVFAGCAISVDPNPQLAPATLIYMIADNNLDYYAMANIKQMEQGIPDDTETNIFVFIDRNYEALGNS